MSNSKNVVTNMTFNNKVDRQADGQTDNLGDR